MFEKKKEDANNCRAEIFGWLLSKGFKDVCII